MFLEVDNVWKKYPGAEALRGVSFGAEAGRVVGVLGENGAGKTTLFKLIASVARPTKGRVLIDGIPAGLKTRAFTAYLPDHNPYYDWMTVHSQMKFLAAFYDGWDMAKTGELLRFLDVPKDKKIGTLSKGQQAKLKIAAAFSWPARLVLMDEPLGGIDPPARKKIVRTLFDQFRGEQTILMATHLVNEVEEFVDDVVFLKKGEVVLSSNADLIRAERGVSLEGLFEEVG